MLSFRLLCKFCQAVWESGDGDDPFLKSEFYLGYLPFRRQEGHEPWHIGSLGNEMAPPLHGDQVWAVFASASPGAAVRGARGPAEAGRASGRPCCLIAPFLKFLEALPR